MKKDKAACPEVSSKTEEAYTEGNQGYVTQSAIPETTENESVVSGGFEKYTVQKNDTLQKISKKFYGTTRKWTKIYDANKEFLKSPDRVRPGQVLNIPVTADFKSPEAMVEPRENLK
ncbi:MAG: LysM peptidoglycan-binding domain-containing protein [Candidatus Omnitrophica bacterium]|nr:LysM peptidoglycan-binding domain-containing protein [Candidatus Omnitrophota bacterium]